MKKICFVILTAFVLFSCKSNTDPNDGNDNMNGSPAVSIAEFNSFGTFGTIGTGGITQWDPIVNFNVTPATANTWTKPLWIETWGKSNAENDACLGFKYGNDVDGNPITPFDLTGMSISRKVNIADEGKYDVTFYAKGGISTMGDGIFVQAAIDGGTQTWAVWDSDNSGWSKYKMSFTGVTAGEHTFTITFTGKNTTTTYFFMDNIEIVSVP